MSFKLYTKEEADAFKKNITAHSVKEVDAEKNGRFSVVISTDDIDRDGQTIRQNGLRIDNFKNNPVALFAHDYHSMPIGVFTDIENKGSFHEGSGVFAPNPLAQQQRQLFDMGLGATSIGFIPLKTDAKNTIVYEADLLEVSFVPVPSNPKVRIIKELGGLDKIMTMVQQGQTIEQEPQIIKDIKTLFAVKDTDVDDEGMYDEKQKTVRSFEKQKMLLQAISTVINGRLAEMKKIQK